MTGCSALKSKAENGTRCANGFFDNPACARPELKLLPPCMRENQAPLPHRIDWQFLKDARPKQDK